MNSQPKQRTDAAADAADSPLFVDLDGTLILSDALHESFVRCLRFHPTKLLMIPFWLAKGRARLKAELAALAPPNAALLPYNERLCAFLRNEKQRGRPIFLATAADGKIARSVAATVGLFDGVVASDGDRNLKGERKLAAIRETVEGDFSYAGNGREDLPIWKAATTALIVNAPATVERWAVRSCQVEQVFPRHAGRLRDILAALRPLRWTKNLLVFVPLLATLRSANETAVVAALLAFGAFCAGASATYLLTDLLTLETDRAEAGKKLQAIASGRVSIVQALALVALLSVAGIAGAAAWSLPLAGVLVGYMIVATARRLVLKPRGLANGIAVTALYAARLAAGAASGGMAIAAWPMAAARHFWAAWAGA